MDQRPPPNPKYWEAIDDNGKPTWRCIVCHDGRKVPYHKTRRHETSATHMDLVEIREREQRLDAEEPASLPAGAQPPYLAFVDSGTRSLLQSISAGAIAENRDDPISNPTPASPEHSLFPGGWNLFEVHGDTDLALSAEKQGVALIAKSLLDRFDEMSIGSDEAAEERSDNEADNEIPEPIVAGNDDSIGSEPPRKRSRNAGRDDSLDPSAKWFPWRDKITCTLDILMHLPRSVFSQRQLDLFLWLLKVNDVDDVPSVKSMQTLNAMLQKMCGIDSIKYKGALGHTYYVNCLAQIIAQEMANPKVRPHIVFYPEDSGKEISEARQACRWLHEAPNEQLTPMARLGNQDYYIHEPAMLRNGTCCIPVRWFTVGAVLFAKCWKMDSISTDVGEGWRVIQCDDFTVSQVEFLKTFPELVQDANLYGLPHPSKILDVVNPDSNTHSAWTFTNPITGNRWRELAKGHRTLCFPIWLYCDDTSGNLSKKWNEHNSFLFMPAGLPRAEAQKEYNIHFLSTSNIAPPLEMMDGIVNQLNEAQERGIWAWDCLTDEAVLLIPMILALLGDNPMQSEFACHIGLGGKFFCRACWVKGTDASADSAEDPNGPHADDRAEQMSDNESAAGSEGASDDGSTSGSKPKSRRKRALESMSNMVNRVKSFVKIGRLRRKDETTEKLKSLFTEASKLGTQTKVKQMRTDSGVKDTYQMFFIDKIFRSYKKKRGTATKQAALDAQLKALPDNITSPVWRIKGLDPHQDTPVEILHVILLGFVKYLWRDLVQNQLGKNDDKKGLLATRLSSFDVSGLGISPLAGQTLVQYSGSLTGRDFRVIAQAAPFVIYDLVSEDCFETWVALSKLVPLIWQPEIKDIDAHCALLDHEIKHFLLCAARWTTRWFNKPKFHIFLHLTEHIRRFGPAILFATEAFESFNAIIRAKSVHSNRHAPSRDIAQAFAQGNRIRHLLSGGSFNFQLPPPLVNQTHSLPATSATAPDVQRPFSDNKSSWKKAGTGPQDLVYMPNTVTQYLGLDDKKQVKTGDCISDKVGPRAFAVTLTGKKLPNLIPSANTRQFKTCRELYLKNGDKCTIGQFVIAQNPNAVGTTFIARVEEIVQIVGSIADYSHLPDGVLLRSADVNRPADKYRMPHIDLLNQWSFVRFEDILCTVNVQHNCAQYQCATTHVRHVYQERERTDQTQPLVSHSKHPEDLMLNTGQMRDAIHVQRYRLRSPDLDEEDIIMASAAREVAVQKAARKTLEPTSSAKAPASTPTLQQLSLPRRLVMLQEVPHASTSSTSQLDA